MIGTIDNQLENRPTRIVVINKPNPVLQDGRINPALYFNSRDPNCGLNFDAEDRYLFGSQNTFRFQKPEIIPESRYDPDPCDKNAYLNI